MKSILPILACLVAVCPAQVFTSGQSDAAHIARIQRMMLSTLQKAKNVAVCDFKKPGGSIVTRVIRGESVKVGQYWNGSGFPERPVLAYESPTDLIGDGLGVISSSGYYQLDPTLKFIVVESWSDRPEVKKDLLIPLQEIEERLNQSGKAALENR